MQTICRKNSFVIPERNLLEEGEFSGMYFRMDYMRPTDQIDTWNEKIMFSKA